MRRTTSSRADRTWICCCTTSCSARPSSASPEMWSSFPQTEASTAMTVPAFQTLTENTPVRSTAKTFDRVASGDGVLGDGDCRRRTDLVVVGARKRTRRAQCCPGGMSAFSENSTFTLCGRDFRAGACGLTLVNIHAEPVRFLQVLTAFITMDATAVGFDPSIFIRDDNGFDPTSHRCTDPARAADVNPYICVLVAFDHCTDGSSIPQGLGWISRSADEGNMQWWLFNEIERFLRPQRTGPVSKIR
ncbi:hypothetical protein FN846DRAFT_276400 [Sphaerosporella brunnea]|uniref:Fungal-type protein kinase domain-containing protein n=1 Tax=Sphaerosporella brunnea TaxID=1250544 RepID=A0A5J5ENM4_9PEZI|nr:hypothetical protein FN846DRAFT_276400 [Sphaerosporella brunnea]